MLSALRLAAALALAGSVVGVLATAVSEAAAEKRVEGFVGGPRGVFAGGGFTEPSDVAVYLGGAGGGRKLLVVEASGRNHRVQRLDRHGNFELAWGRDVVRRGAGGDRGRGFEVCREPVAGAEGCKAAPAGGGAGELRMPTAVAVSEATGDVYVMDRGNRRVQRFDLDGRFVSAWGWGVATGSPRYEVCEVRCRPGRRHVGGPVARAGWFAPAEHPMTVVGPSRFDPADNGAIAVSPRPPHHVFVGDEGNDRVVELTASGRLLRVWGWGVATGRRRFETCPATAGCRAGRRRDGRGWPRHLAVDAQGVVYAGESGDDGQVIRFAADPPPGRPAAAASLLAPLAFPGWPMGLAIDKQTGVLAVARDPFGAMVVHELPNPATPRPRSVLVDSLPFLDSVNGIASHDGTIYMAKSTHLYPIDPITVLTACGPDGRPCNGIAVAAPTGPIKTALTGSFPHRRTGVVLVGAIAAPAPVRYRFQTSTDGQSWTNATPTRLAADPTYTRIAAIAHNLTPNHAHQARLIAWPTGDADPDRASSNPLTVIVPAGGGR